MTRSPSQVSQYGDCAHKYWLSRVARVIPRPAAWSHQGTAVHTAAEAYERSGRQMQPEQVVEVYHEQYTALVDESLTREPDTNKWVTAGPEGAEDIAQRYILGRSQTAEYVEWARVHKPAIWKAPDGTPGLELPVQGEIGGVPVRGIIDQVIQHEDGSVRIRDVKTGSTKSKLQLKTYGLLFRDVFNVAVKDADWYMAKKGGLSRPLDITEATEEEVGAEYVKMDRGVKAGEFPAKPGFLCRFCDVSHACEFRR
ncbi:RecB family exonuclease [Streptomyces sp. NPDC087850]|uniref:RecB family exonuclease n=1 Tax=Streptomyces sp. NPDC087850 TaxID=3365809 RepID=UPI00381F117C